MNSPVLTGIKDLDYKILNKLDDKSLVSFCSTNKKADKYCDDQTFWMNRTFETYYYINSDILKKYKGERSWSDYYILDLRKVTRPMSFIAKAQQSIKDGRLDHIMILYNYGIGVNAPMMIKFAEAKNQPEIVKYLKSVPYKYKMK
jgi:hypothetical protein